MIDCIFCKIAKHELPAKIVFENDNTIAFNDVSPKAPVHILIIPKTHIESIAQDKAENIVKELIIVAKQIAKEKNLDGYKLVFNVGKKAGQTIQHLHLHLLSAKNQDMSSQLNI